MANKTTNYGLTKPLPEEFYDINVHNENMDIVDEELKKVSDAAASGKRTVRLTVGTSDAGWTADQCDYLCDGDADDVEINAAIAALPSTGGELVLLDGSYDITAPININKNYVVLHGNGHKTKLYRGFDGDRLIYVSGNYAVIEDLSINGMSYSYTSTSNKGIYTLTSNTVVRNCTIEQEAGEGIHIAEGKAKVIGNTVLYCGTGIYVDDNENVVSDNIVLECTAYGIRVCDDYNVVTGNVSRLNATANLQLYYAEYCTITGNNFAVVSGDSVTPTYAIYLYSSYNNYNIVTDNQVGSGTINNGGGTGNVVSNTPVITDGTTDLTAGSSALATGATHFVYE